MDVTLTPCGGVIPRCAICHDDAPEQALVCSGCGTLVHSSGGVPPAEATNASTRARRSGE